MADNSTPKAYEPLIQLLEAAADGAHTHGTAIGLAHNTEAAIRADLIALVGAPAGPGGHPPALPGLKFAWDQARANKSAKIAALHTANSQGRFLARMCVRTLTPVLGESWNAQWDSVGFTSGSLAIPTAPLALLQHLRGYYGQHPTREMPNFQGVACTAAACEAAVQALSDAESARNQSQTDAGTAKAAFDAAFAAASVRISHLRDELAQLIAADDERWYAFGFDKPSEPTTPDVPANLVVTPGATGSKLLLVECTEARRATGYRFRAVNKSAHQEVASHLVQAAQTTLALTNVAAGTQVDVTVIARNAKGESQPTEPITATVP